MASIKSSDKVRVIKRLLNFNPYEGWGLRELESVIAVFDRIEEDAECRLFDEDRELIEIQIKKIKGT